MSGNKIKDRLRSEEKNSLAYLSQLCGRVQDIGSLGEPAITNLLKSIIPTLVDLEKEQDGNMTVLQTELAFTTLLAIGTVHSCAETSPSLKSLVSSNAGLLMAWIRYFYRRKDERLFGRGSTFQALATKGMKQLLIDTLSSALHTIYEVHSVHKEYLYHIQPSLDIIAGLWLMKDPTKSNGCQCLSTLLGDQLGRETTRDEMTRALVASANGDSDRVARKVITRLRRAMKKAPGHFRPMCLLLRSTMVLATNRDHAISDSLYEHQIFTTFSKCLRLVASSNNAVNFVDLENYLNILTLMVHKDAENGERALRQCVRYGMLEVIARLLMDESYGERLDSHTSSTNTRIVLSLLIHGLNIESVCNEISNAFKRLPLAVLSMDISGSAMRDIWKHFVNEVMVRSIFVKFRTLARACDKEGELCFYCKQRFPKHTLQICGTCNFVKFCSVACQTEDQTVRYHKVVCDFFVRHYGYGAISNPLSSAERNVRQFGKCVAFYDVRRHRAHLRRLAMLEYPKVDPKFIGIILDYYSGFPSFDFFLLPTPILEPYHRLMTAFNTRFLGYKRTEQRREATIVIISHPYAIGRDSKDKQNIHSFETHDEGLGDGPQNPRLRPGIKEAEKRACGRYRRGDVPLEPCYDEVDEIMRRMLEETKKFPELMQDPLTLVDRVFNDLDNDWPFESPFQLQNTSFHSD